MYEIIDATGQVVMIPNIMGIFDSKLIDILAWQFHVDFYDPTRDLDFRKRLVQMSIIWHKTKGTVALVEEVINTYWPGVAFLQEWFEYKSPFPPNYPVVNVDEWACNFTPADVNVTQDRFQIQTGGNAEDEKVFFVLGQPGNTLPAPFVAGTDYYVRNHLKNSFQLSATLGGTPIDITSSGTGEHNELWARGAVGGTWHDRYRFRVIINEEVDPAIADQVVALINLYKPISRWLEDILLSRVSTCVVFVGCYAKIFTHRISQAADLRGTD